MGEGHVSVQSLCLEQSGSHKAKSRRKEWDPDPGSPITLWPCNKVWVAQLERQTEHKMPSAVPSPNCDCTRKSGDSRERLPHTRASAGLALPAKQLFPARHRPHTTTPDVATPLLAQGQPCNFHGGGGKGREVSPSLCCFEKSTALFT